MAQAQPRKSPSGTKKKAKKNLDRRNIWLLVVTAILIVVSIGLFAPPSKTINQGLDIQGGLSVVLTAKSDDGGAVSSEDMEKSRAIIESRVNALGATEATVQVQGENQILVQIPGLSDTETALDTIGKTGKLEFARLDSFTDPEVVSAIESGSYGTQGTVTDSFGNTFPTDQVTHLTVPDGTYTPLITGDNIKNVQIGMASEVSTDYAVSLRLDAAGTEAFAEATRELAPTNGKIVIILDNEVQSAPAVQSEIPTGEVQITGNYTQAEAESLRTILESGSLPVTFEYSQSQVVGPTLGQGALYYGVIAALIGLIAVMIYLLFFYKGLGVITAAAMVVFALLYLGILAGLSRAGQFSLSLAGVAGIVLTIGMAADSSILTMERFREEIRMGRSVRAASQSGVKHAILTSIDADLVTLVSALCLFFLAAASVKGFGFTLALGILCDIVMMVLFKAPLIRLLAPRVIAKNPGFWGIKDSIAASEDYAAVASAEGSSVSAAATAMAISPQISAQYARQKSGDAGQAAVDGALSTKGRFIKKDINFLGKRKVFLSVSAALVVLCFAFMGIRGLHPSIEFVGGSSISYTNTGDVTDEQLREAFVAAGEENPVIQTTSSNGNEGFMVRIASTDAQAAAEIANQVASTLGFSSSDLEVTTIGPDWGSSVVKVSLIAFFVSLILIIVYIGIRFEYKMGIIAIVALLHDLIIVVGIYALVGREVTPNMIAALLTILGYSLYDTVVVFHRINDNMKGQEIRCSFMTMANHSLNQVLLRTINTTLTSIIPVLAMLFFGGETLQDFAFAMVVGLIAGSYSSIAVATPLFSIWKTREKKNAKLVKKFGEDVGYFEFANAGAPTVAAEVAVPGTANQASAVASAGEFLEKTDDSGIGQNVGKQSAGKSSSANQGKKRIKRPVKK